MYATLMAFAAQALAPSLATAAVAQFGFAAANLPKLETTALPDTTKLGSGTTLTNTAKVTDRVDAQSGATVTFKLFGPGNPTCVIDPTDPASAPVRETTVTYDAAGEPVVMAVPYLPTIEGTYRWLVSYSGDMNNDPVPGECGGAGHETQVSKATPVLSTVASAATTLGGAPLTDTATVSGRFDPQIGGTVTFTLYGPDDATCVRAPTRPPSVVTLRADSDVATSPEYVPIEAGTYQWVASYSGDAKNADIPGVCGVAGESTVVGPKVATIVTTPSPAFALGSVGRLTDGAAVTGRVAVRNQDRPSINFKLYGPNDLTCTTILDESNVRYPDTGSGIVNSDAYTPTRAGIYRWVVSYSGDRNNNPEPSPCSAANQTIVEKATPTLATTASPTTTFGSGGQLTDSVTVDGRVNPQGAATVDFRLYGRDDLTCSGPVLFPDLGNLYPAAGGPLASAPFPPPSAGTFRWVVSYSGDANNTAVTGPCSSANQTFVGKATPVISTTASSATVLGGASLSDEARVTGRFSAQDGATIRFRLYGPGVDPCTGVPIFTAPDVPYPVADSTVTSATFAPQVPGTYSWRASYSGDMNNTPVSGPCVDVLEQTTVGKARPTLTAIASQDVALGAGTLRDEATVKGQFSPTGAATIDFRLYGPDNDTCTGMPAFSQLGVISPVAESPLTSAAFTPTQAGPYRWQASYSGDSRNESATSPCLDSDQAATVAKFTPSVATVASPDIVLSVGSSLTAAVTVTGRFNALSGATVDFKLYGPGDATCTGPELHPTPNVPYPAAGAPTVTSTPFTPTKAGIYRWVTSYSGDTNNASVDNACNGPKQNVDVSGVTATLTTTASPNIVVGAGSLSDEATVTGRTSPQDGARIDFKLYGPNDATCGGAPAFEAPKVPYPISGGPVKSAAFTPQHSGTYRWVASYSGDVNNVPVDGACNATGETVIVARNTASLMVSPSPTIAAGEGSLTDTVTMVGRFNPLAGGSVDFRLFGPGDPTCAGPAVFLSLGVTYPVLGGPVTSAAYATTKPGTYHWVAAYGGEANNAPVNGTCDEANATTVAVGRPAQRAPIRALPQRVTSATTPKRDPTVAYRFTTKGKVVAPPDCAPNSSAAFAGLRCVLPICPPDSASPAECKQPSQAQICADGQVTIRFKRFAYTLSARSVAVRRDCTFRSTVIIKTRNPLRRGSMRVFTSFEGNPLLLPRRASVQVVRAG